MGQGQKMDHRRLQGDQAPTPASSIKAEPPILRFDADLHPGLVWSMYPSLEEALVTPK